MSFILLTCCCIFAVLSGILFVCFIFCSQSGPFDQRSKTSKTAESFQSLSEKLGYFSVALANEFCTQSLLCSLEHGNIRPQNSDRVLPFFLRIRMGQFCDSSVTRILVAAFYRIELLREILPILSVLTQGVCIPIWTLKINHLPLRDRYFFRVLSVCTQYCMTGLSVSNWAEVYLEIVI